MEENAEGWSTGMPESPVTNEMNKVLAFDTCVCEWRWFIFEDIGAYDGVENDFDMHGLRFLYELPYIPDDDAITQEIVRRNNGYGCGMGGIKRLYPISDEDAERLIAHNSAIAKGRNMSYDVLKYREMVHKINLAGRQEEAALKVFGHTPSNDEAYCWYKRRISSKCQERERYAPLWVTQEDLAEARSYLR